MHVILADSFQDSSGAQAASRLLTCWCWRERLVTAFSASLVPSEGAELHQELLLSFDVCEGCEYSVLSMIVKKTQASGWFAELEVRFLIHTDDLTTCILVQRQLCDQRIDNRPPTVVAKNMLV